MSLELRDEYDVAVIGAGPAGLAAASLCSRAKLSTVLFDEQAAPGGQVYRGVTRSPFSDRSILGADYWAGEKITREFFASGAQYVPRATVWSVTGEREIGVSVGGGSRLLQAKHVIIATGALERPFPIPGWTLPGVMTAGGAQTLLKGSGIVPEGRTVLAGSGPLLWLLAAQLLNAGATLDAILDTTSRESRARARPHLPSFLVSPYLFKGLKLLREVRKRVRVVGDVTALEARGEARVQSAVYATGRNAATIETPVDNLLLHQGVVPNVNLAMSIGIEHRWDDEQLCFVPALGPCGETAVAGIYIAGDGGGIAGAQAAAWRGVMSASAIVRTVNAEAARRAAKAARTALDHFARGRKFLDAYYRPAPQFRMPAGETLACRCEEVTARQITDTVALGCPGPNQMKSFLRCGMGPCQGRLCGLTVTELIARERGVSPQEVGHYRLRPPVKPITVAELAELPKDDAAVKAVVRI
jgi:NADPH-dependent 2,4-dienoyl-CoA reductase/sulfur reductase-like enzyme